MGSYLKRVRRFIARAVPARLEMKARYQYLAMLGRLERELPILAALATNTSRFIDVGAHYGHWTYYMSTRFKHVDAFEPLERCSQTIRRAEIENICVHSCALSDSIGERVLYIPRVGKRTEGGLASLVPIDDSETVVVPVRTLDDFELKGVGALKIDVEGHEDQVLLGATDTLKRERPAVVVEIEKRHRSAPPQETFELMQSLHYLTYFLDANRRLRLSTEFDWDKHQDISRIGTSEYINNFIFLPQEGR